MNGTSSAVARTHHGWDCLVAAFLDTAAVTSRLLRTNAVAAAWNRASALDTYTVGTLVAHIVQATERTVEVLAEPEPSDRRLVGVAEFYGRNRLEAGASATAGLHRAARAAAVTLAEAGRYEVVDRFDLCRSHLEIVLGRTEPHRLVSVLQIPDGAATIESYLRTRVVELVIHGDDVGASVGVAFSPPVAATGVALDVCLRMARASSGDMNVLRAFARQERASMQDVRVF